jgi:hypothetical protein
MNQAAFGELLISEGCYRGVLWRLRKKDAPIEA